MCVSDEPRIPAHSRLKPRSPVSDTGQYFPHTPVALSLPHAITVTAISDIFAIQQYSFT
jgi:hypothetical protein